MTDGTGTIGQDNTNLPAVTAGSERLNAESLELIERLIAESDPDKANELTYLFNLNQNKKALARVNKLSDLLDTMTDQALTRFEKRPDEISNKELLDGLKTIQDLIERGQKQSAAEPEKPATLIQINQNNTEVNVGASTKASALNRESRERVKNAVLTLLGGLQLEQPTQDPANLEVVEDQEVADEE